MHIQDEFTIKSRNSLYFSEFIKKKTLTKTSVSFEVWIGVEPTNSGFADRSLTAWVPHQNA